MDYVRAHFGSEPKGLGFKVESRETEGVGYDLLMTKGDCTLCVEVKGRSSDEVSADFSRGESRAVLDVQEGRFEDGEYRVCIVTDALNEHDKRKLHHFRWSKKKKSWIEVESSQRLVFCPSGSTVAKLDA